RRGQRIERAVGRAAHGGHRHEQLRQRRRKQARGHEQGVQTEREAGQGTAQGGRRAIARVPAMCTPPTSSRGSKALAVSNVASRAYARRHRSMPGGNAMLCDTMARRCTAPVLLLFGMVGLAGVLSPGRAGAQAVTAVYTVSFQGQPAGSLRSTADTDGRVVADYTYRDNGRGPDLHEEARFAADVRLRSEPALRYFADMYPGYQTIEAGWEADGPRLLALQLEAEKQLLQALAERLRHPVDGLLLIRDVRVFDAEHARLTGPSDVYVRRGRIAAVLAAGSKLSDAATVVDGRGRTLLPGLFDMHGHEWTWNAMLQIAGGVTTVRDLGNQNDYLRDLIERID